MTRIIGIISGKGGVGKTVTTVSLASALASRGIDTLILDGNLTTPNLSIHLGIPFYKTTLNDVLEKKADISRAIYKHSSGIKIVPASLSLEYLKKLDVTKLESVMLELLGKSKIIIIDAAAGLGREAQAILKLADELIIVTNPEMPAVVDALKTIKLAQEYGTKILGVVINKAGSHKHEMPLEEVVNMLEVPVLAIIPHDAKVSEAVAFKMPVTIYSPKSKASKEFRHLASVILGEKAMQEEEVQKGFVEKIFSWLRGS